MSRSLVLAYFAALAVARPQITAVSTGALSTASSIEPTGTITSDATATDFPVLPSGPGLDNITSTDGSGDGDFPSIADQDPSLTNISTPVKPFSLKAISDAHWDINGLDIKVAEGYFWIGRDDAKSAPLIIEDKGARLFSNAPGGQIVYVEKSGALSFTPPHGPGIPEDGRTKNFALLGSEWRQSLAFEQKEDPNNGVNGTFTDKPIAHSPWLACPITGTATTSAGGSNTTAVARLRRRGTPVDLGDATATESVAAVQTDGTDPSGDSTDGTGSTDDAGSDPDFITPGTTAGNDGTVSADGNDKPITGPLKIYATQDFVSGPVQPEGCVSIEINAPFLPDAAAKNPTMDYFY